MADPGFLKPNLGVPGYIVGTEVMIQPMFLLKILYFYSNENLSFPNVTPLLGIASPLFGPYYPK